MVRSCIIKNFYASSRYCRVSQYDIVYGKLGSMRKVLSNSQRLQLRTGGIGSEMKQFLSTCAKTWSISSSIEIGVAGGSGSEAIIDSGSTDHHGIDISEKFYYDNKLYTGDLVNGDPCFTLHIGHLSEVLLKPSLPNFNFVYIDADHSHPAPTIDLLNLAVAEKLNFPFRLVLDDVGLSMKYRKENFKWRGPSLLCSMLSNKFKPTFSPAMPKSQMNGLSIPNQVCFDIDSRDLLLMALQDATSKQPFEKQLDSFVIL